MSPPPFSFEWNRAKAAANVRKHHIRFEEAATTFVDRWALVIDDPEHSADEPRQILIGYSDRRRLLFVSFVQRSDERIRIVSARKADAQERADYEEKNRFAP
jgi:uncharacterized DUF497 family protein